MRLDQALAARFPYLSRRAARALIASHRVLLNERPVAAASREVGEGDRITIAPETPALEVLTITDDFIAVNKPAGMFTQPSRDRRRASLEELLRVYLKQQRLPARVHLVHRLDAGTSGVVIFARSPAAAAVLSEQFASRRIRKVYVARIEGTIDRSLTIDSPIGGKDASTVVRPRGDGLVEAEMRTGRTHQIRIHLASIGHPVLGDRRYGGPVAPRLMLHACRIECEITGVIEAALPDGFA